MAWTDITSHFTSSTVNGTSPPDFSFIGGVWVNNYVGSVSQSFLIPDATAIALSAGASALRLTLTSRANVPTYVAAQDIYFGYGHTGNPPGTDTAADASGSTTGTVYANLAVATFQPFTSTGLTAMLVSGFMYIGDYGKQNYDISAIEIIEGTIPNFWTDLVGCEEQ